MLLAELTHDVTDVAAFFKEECGTSVMPRHTRRLPTKPGLCTSRFDLPKGDRVKPLFSRHRSRLNTRANVFRHGYQRVLFYRNVSFPLQELLCHTTVISTAMALTLLGHTIVPMCSIDTALRSLFRTWLLHVFHIHPVLRGWRGMHPSYCFRGTTATRWRRPILLRPISDVVSGFPETITRSPAHEHSLAVSYSCTTLAVTPHLFGSGVRTAVPVFAYPSFLISKSPPKSFSERARYLTPSGFGRYHHTLFKGSNGRRVTTPATELAWLVP